MRTRIETHPPRRLGAPRPWPQSAAIPLLWGPLALAIAWSWYPFPPARNVARAAQSETTSDQRSNAETPEVPDVFARRNLVAWCIVPFDAKNRGPAERAEMVRQLGFTKVAYDWREQHVPTFETEILEYEKRDIEFFAFWSWHDAIEPLIRKHGIRPQIWQTCPSPDGATRRARIEAAAEALLPLTRKTRELGIELGLYNHGGWGGEPNNLVDVCRHLRDEHEARHVGIVYNLHHGHEHLEDFEKSLARMKPYLLCLNLNGMTHGGPKILPLGEGELDVKLLGVVRRVGYRGPIGIIGHTQDDVRQRLQDNLDGLDWILPQLDGKPAGPKPKLRTWSPATRESSAPPRLAPRVIVDGRDGFRDPPLTIRCRATLTDRSNYNILVASDAKRSGAHWEIFSMVGTGMLTAYLPGRRPDHVRSSAMICDGRPHTITMSYTSQRVRLSVDGRVVADQPIESNGRPTVPGNLAIGGLVEGDFRCSGTIDWVRITRGIDDGRDSAGDAEAAEGGDPDENTLLHWRAENVNARDSQQRHSENSGSVNEPRGKVEEPGTSYSSGRVASLLDVAMSDGDASRGLMVFGSAKSACLSCHKLGAHGGGVGPELTEIGKQRKPEEIVESILWPAREVKPEFVAHQIVTADGRSHRGYVSRQDARSVTLRDPTKVDPAEAERTFEVEDIELREEVGTLMPDNLVAAMSETQLNDLIRFVVTLGRGDGLARHEYDHLMHHVMAHLHGPATFPWEREPLHPEHWPSWQAEVNRDRVYDFYTKQADHFRRRPVTPPLLAPFPGLDGGQLGHWGNQNEQAWASDRWNDTDLGSLQCGVFRGAGKTVPRGVCVRFGPRLEMSACFNPETLRYEAVWTGGFVRFSSVRHGFLNGLTMDGTPVSVGETNGAVADTKGSSEYLGFYRVGPRVVFAYRVDGREYLDSPWVEDGRFAPMVAVAERHPLRDKWKDESAQWPQVIETAIEAGTTEPYAVDTIGLPTENPWRSRLFCGGHDFLPDDSALVCTIQGDVWKVTGFEYPSRKAKWRRFASGLHHALGLVADEDGIFVLGRDQITRLHDVDGDDEADFYECFSSAYDTSPAGHDFICGLARDRDGRFHTASGNQGVVRVSADGKSAEVLATGLRNPDGIHVTPDGLVTVPCSEGDWTPASMICAFPADLVSNESGEGDSRRRLHFGYGGPRDDRPPDLPMVYLPRGLDNSSGGQVTVPDDRWGPLRAQLLHFSFGAGSHFLVLRDKVDGQLQGAVVPLPGEFRSGAHRGRFRPADGQLYVSGMQGWGSYTPDDGCFQRVRYTGRPVQLPVGIHVHRNGVAIEFSRPLDSAADDSSNHFAQCWNYRYSRGYGSPELSAMHPPAAGHDTLTITSAHRLADGRTLFLEIPEIQPVNQLHLQVRSDAESRHDLFVTVHRLDEPLTNIPGYRPVEKTVKPHPILTDLALATRRVENPHRARIEGARAVTIETGDNLTYKTRLIRARCGEPLALTLTNPDVVPHNWALARPGTLRRVGELANRMIADPEAVVRHYVPRTSDVLAYTDVVSPGESFTIYFHAPEEPGRYPFLCTFPGHWLVMNGELIVERGTTE